MTEKPTYEETSEDLGKLRKTEEMLQNVEKKYQRLLETLEHEYIIYGHDTNGNFTHLSPSINNILGYSQNEFMGHYAEYITDNPINNDVEGYTQAGLRGERQDPFEAEYWHKNGHRVHLRVTEIPLFDDNGNVLGIEGIVQDVSKIKQAEKDREDMIIKLEKALSEIKTLKGILPLCSFCKKVRDDEGYWEQVDIYIHKHSEADISHGICPDCLKKHYPGI